MALVMTKLSLLAVLLIGASAASATASRILSGEASPMRQRHEQWMAKHGKTYRNDAEKAQRFEIFKSNMEHIESFNAGKHKYWLGPNLFTDLTNEEFKAIYSSGYKRSTSSRPKSTFRYENVSVDADDLDWRSKGAVTPIKNQLQCGACWAFSSIAAVEGINQIKNGNLISLSEQELIDCDVNGESHGCSGGVMDDAFQFIINNGGINTEINYPYTATQGSCNTTAETNSTVVTISGFEDVPANSEASLLQAVSIQPVSVGIDGGDPNFQSYSGGTFVGPCGTDIDHAVTVIGYGVDTNGTKFWLVKNSWGTDWGYNGYIMIQRDIDAAEGLCGIAMQASYPTIN